MTVRFQVLFQVFGAGGEFGAEEGIDSPFEHAQLAAWVRG